MSNNLWNAILAGALFGAAHGMTVPVRAHHPEPTNPSVLADHTKGHIKGYHTMDSLGCLIVGECTDNVRRIKSISDITREYPDSDFGAVADEFNSIIKAFDRIGVGVFLADSKYFPVGHRGVYHTVSNNFYLNDAFMHRQSVLMSVTRHEGWHAAQDCMAGSIKNSMIAIIKPEDSVPMVWRTMAERTYPKSAVPWEAEAGWAGRTEGMTAQALEACATGKMWEIYSPTPLTKKWLQENNFLPHIEYDFHHHHFGHYKVQEHSHIHWHHKKDLIHKHKHEHGYGHRHHGIGTKHKVNKPHKTVIKFHVH